MFPRHKLPAIAGSLDESPGSTKINLSQLFGPAGGVPEDALAEAETERRAYLEASQLSNDDTTPVDHQVGASEQTPTNDADGRADSSAGDNSGDATGGTDGERDELDALIDELDALDP